MTFHPYFQIQSGDSPITRVPPEYVRSIRYASSIEALSTFEFDVIDPTYTTVEQLLLWSDVNKRPIISRFGYIDNVGNVSGNWIQTRLLAYSPTLTHRGTEITTQCLIDVGNKVIEVQSKVYRGRISNVVQQIADDIGIDAEIEETNDDINEQSVDDRGGLKTWRTGGLTPIRFIREALLPLARSKSSKSNYSFWITGVGSREQKPRLHFHTLEYPNCSTRVKGVKEFTYLVGSQDQVIEFKPNYDSSLLGAMGGGQVVMRAQDPITGQFVNSVENVRNNPDTIALGDGDRTILVPPVDALANEDLYTQAGFHILSEASSADALARARNRWELLKAYSFTASIVLVGIPDVLRGSNVVRGTGTVDLEANDLMRVNVLIPNPPGTPDILPYRKHWSSGLYLVTEAVHEIESQYSVTCQLRRDQSEVGAQTSEGATFQPAER